jgi:large subunit ribosomal protein L18e
MTNQVVLHIAKELRVASKKNRAPIWSRLADMTIKPSRARRVLNLGQLDKFVNDNEVVVVPGKVLGAGNISHKITLCSFSISTSGAKKVIQSGGKILTFSQLIRDNPTGKGVKIIV